MSRPESSSFPVLLVVGTAGGIIFIIFLLLLCCCRQSAGETFLLWFPIFHLVIILMRSWFRGTAWHFTVWTFFSFAGSTRDERVSQNENEQQVYSSLLHGQSFTLFVHVCGLWHRIKLYLTWIRKVLVIISYTITIWEFIITLTGNIPFYHIQFSKITHFICCSFNPVKFNQDRTLVTNLKKMDSDKSFSSNQHHRHEMTDELCFCIFTDLQETFVSMKQSEGLKTLEMVQYKHSISAVEALWWYKNCD